MRSNTALETLGHRAHARIPDRSLRGEAVHEVPQPSGWANSAPLALAAFAVCAFMLSMINAGLVDASSRQYVWGVAFTFGGITQLIAGLIQLRSGQTFNRVLFSAFGGFWLSLFAIAEFFQSSVPIAQQGYALGLFLYAFAIFATYMFLASFRTKRHHDRRARRPGADALPARRRQLQRHRLADPRRRLFRPGSRSACLVPVGGSRLRGHLPAQGHPHRRSLEVRFAARLHRPCPRRAGPAPGSRRPLAIRPGPRYATRPSGATGGGGGDECRALHRFR